MLISVLSMSFLWSLPSARKEGCRDAMNAENLRVYIIPHYDEYLSISFCALTSFPLREKDDLRRASREAPGADIK